jgi:hypothetical protein
MNQVKRSLNRKTARGLEATHCQSPHGIIQWKGTDVCMDIRCICGTTSHIDGEFAYEVECPDCRQAYYVNGHVELIAITDKQDPIIGI